MKGKILNFKADKGFGFILGEDNQKYFFHISAVSNPMDIEEGYSIDFKTKEGKKGLNAIDIIVQTPLSGGKSKDKMLKIDNLRIRASDVKEYIINKSVSRTEIKVEKRHYKLWLWKEFKRSISCSDWESSWNMNIDDGGYSYIGEFKDTEYNKWLQSIKKTTNHYSDDDNYVVEDTKQGFYNVGDSQTQLVDQDGVYYQNEEGYLRVEFLSDDVKYDSNDYFELKIITYTSGIKTMTFEIEEEANKWLDYIDEEMDKLI